jgi:hypothetical protein
MNITDEILEEWNSNRLKNPITKRNIKLNGPTYIKFLKKYEAKNKTTNIISYKYTKNDLKLIINMQKKFRNNYLTKISGPGYTNPLVCNNDKDIISLESIWIEKNNKKILNMEFDKFLLFTYKNKNIIYGLNIRSFEELLKNKIYKDPFTNLKLNNSIIENINKKINFINKIKEKPKKEKYNYSQIINSKIINIIKIMEANDIYLNIEWLKKIKKNMCFKLYYELQHIINYYKNNYNNMYNMIITNNYFTYTNNYLKNLNYLQFKNLIFEIIYSILNNSHNTNVSKMACYLILTTFCYVSPEIKNAYPDIEFY